VLRENNIRLCLPGFCGHTLRSNYYCTECVVELKDGADAHAILGEIQNAVDDGLGDSVATVKGPTKEGGEMLKVHILC
jgi:hypothetical protein